MSKKILFRYGSILLFLCISFVFLCANTSVAEAAKNGRIIGYVYDSDGNAIKKAAVSCEGQNTGKKKRARTKSTGSFKLKNLKADTYTVTVTKDNYETHEEEVTLAEGKTEKIEIVLQKKGGSSGSFKLPDTGQTTSHTDTFGEDADYLINAPSYTDNGDGTVTDNNTGLMWQQEDDDTYRTWEDAGIYSEALTLAGYTDWRLPTVIELSSIVDHNVYNPSIDVTYFPNTNSSDFWSSTTTANITSVAWEIDFYDGGGYGNHKSNSSYVMCVRGGQLKADFTDNGNGTVTDNVTGLMWQQEDDNTKRNWEGAITYAEDLSFAGYTDWRLPNIKELRSIVDYNASDPSIDVTFFPSTRWYYWSSTTYAEDTKYVWEIDFDEGGDGVYYRYTGNYVRCVRGGQGTPTATPKTTPTVAPTATPTATPKTTGSFKLPDTGQTTSYTDTFGEDADYLINAPSYTDNGDGTVTDNNTGLMWQQEDDDTTRTWEDAGIYSEALTLAGYTDWRLPTVNELSSIVDYNVYDPSIDVTYFTNTNSWNYWSSTTFAGNTSNAWSIYFYHGSGNGYGKSGSNYVRCVRGGQ